MTLSRFISRLVQGRGPATDSGPSGLAELLEKHRAGVAGQSAALGTSAGTRSWHDMALSAMENGDEDFAGKLVGFVEKELRRMS